MVEKYLQVVTSILQQKELDILVLSLVIAVSKKNMSEMEESHGKTNWKYFQR